MYETWNDLITKHGWKYEDVMEADLEHLVAILSIKENKNKRGYRDVVDPFQVIQNKTF